MYNRIVGNILAIKQGVILQGVNAQGVMGSGLAKQIRAKYPDVFWEYQKHHIAGTLKLGTVIPVQVEMGKWVVSGCTQHFYGRDWNQVYVDYNAISDVFDNTLTWMKQHQLNKLYFPKIGAGLGNGDWEKISAIINTKQPKFPYIALNLVELNESNQSK